MDNIDEYSVEELMQILQIQNPSKEIIKSQTNFYIDKYVETNTELANFFREAQKKLLGFLETSSTHTEQGDEWRENQYLINDNPSQNEKITNRPQSVEINNDSDHILMKRKQLGINQNFQVPVASGNINPNLTNTFSRIINIDSQFRQNNVPSSKGVDYNDISTPVSLSTWSSTNFSLDLSDPLTNVLSLKLYSLQIPFSWYNIPLGLNCFYITCRGVESPITIDPGNYTNTNNFDDLKKGLNAAVKDICPGLTFKYEPLTGLFSIENSNVYEITITFWKNINDISCGTDCDISPKVNNNLGWLLGFRNTSYSLSGIIDGLSLDLLQLNAAYKALWEGDNKTFEQVNIYNLWVYNSIEDWPPNAILALNSADQNNYVLCRCYYKFKPIDNEKSNYWIDYVFYNLTNRQFEYLSLAYEALFGDAVLPSQAQNPPPFTNVTTFTKELPKLTMFFSYTSTLTSNIVKAEAVPNLNGPNYIIIMLEDFNTNRINKGLVTIQDTEARLSLPKYYQSGNVNQLGIDRPICTILTPNALYPNNTYVDTPVYSQGTPPIITQKQQYSLNEIIKNRKNVTNEKINAPSTTNVFAIVPLRSAGKPFGELITEFSGPLPLNIRNYFGPVDIERMRVTLYDDKGNVMNLNGADWSFTMISEHLYQY